jgi:hypothetical protein
MTTTTDNSETASDAVDEAEAKRLRQLDHQRERYKNDADYRERVKAAALRRYAAIKEMPAHREKLRQYKRERRRANPDRYAAEKGWHRASERGATLVSSGYATVAELLTATTAYYALARRLTAETDQEFEVDHLVPLAVGGVHRADNLQVVSRHFNRLKQTRENDEILTALYRGDDVPLLPEVVLLVVDDLEAVTIEAALAGVHSRARRTLELLLKVLLRSDNAPTFNPVAVGALIADLKSAITAATPAEAA